MINLQETIAEFFVSTRLLINNSLTEPIKSAISLFGYTEENLTKTLNLLSTVENLHNIQQKEYGDQYQAYDDYLQIKSEANENYKDLLTIAKIAFKSDVGAQQALGLYKNRKRSFSGWLTQALQFCNNLISNPNFMTAMEKYGQGVEKIQEFKKQITDTQTYLEAHRSETGEAQQATKDRDEKLDELVVWVSDYKKIVRIALKDKPQLLEKLGLLERS